MSKLNNKYIKLGLIFFIGFILGIFLCYLINSIGEESEYNNLSDFQKEIRKGGYTFINPLLECNYPDTISTKTVKETKYKINNLVSNYLESKKAKDIAFYFRDLNNGSWFGINEKAEFSPASMLKVPIMIAYYKLSEVNPDILMKKIKFDIEDQNNIENIKPTHQIERDKEYTVDELIKYMIVYSDNNAKNLLYFNLPEADLNRIYTDLGIAIPGIRKAEDFMTVTEYASFFRILYNSSYLNEVASEKALKILKDAEFNDGIAKKIPSNIVVTNKFGERKIDDVTQLHDCGIVYYPDHPYLICIMTRGSSFEEQEKIIQDLSYETYKKVNEYVQNK